MPSSSPGRSSVSRGSSTDQTAFTPRGSAAEMAWRRRRYFRTSFASWSVWVSERSVTCTAVGSIRRAAPGDDVELRHHGVHRVDDVGRSRGDDPVRRLGRVGRELGIDPGAGRDAPEPLRQDFRLGAPELPVERVQLPVRVGLVDPLPVDEREPAHPGPGEGLGGERAHASQPEDDDVRVGEPLHPLDAEEAGRAVLAGADLPRRAHGSTGGRRKRRRAFAAVTRSASSRLTPRAVATAWRTRGRFPGSFRVRWSGRGVWSGASVSTRSRSRGTARTAATGLRAPSYVSGPAKEKWRPRAASAGTWSARPEKLCITPPFGTPSRARIPSIASAVRNEWRMTGSPSLRAMTR